MSMALTEMATLVGTEIGVSDWILIDQDMINKFAALTGDDQFHHINPERAKETPYGSTIAHGMLTLSLLRAMYESSEAPYPMGMKMAISYGANRLRFTSAVPSGTRVRGHFKLLELTPKEPSMALEVLEFFVEVEGQKKPALIAEWLIQFVLE